MAEVSPETLHEVVWRRHRLRLRVMGDGPPVILVHNAGADHHVWLPVARALAGDHTVVLPDLPGFGRSDRPRVRYDLALFADALDAVIDHVGSPVALAGLCVGGAAAWASTARRPGRVTALTLVHPATWRTVSAGPVGWLHALVGEHDRRRRTATRAVRAGIRRAVVRKALVRALTVSPLPASARRNVDAALARPDTVRVLSAILADLRSFAILDDFVRPHGWPPTLLAWGGGSRVVPPASFAHVADRLLPDAVLHLDDAGHLAPLERPALLAGAIQRILPGG